MKKLTSINFWLLLLLGIASVVFTACSKSTKDDPTAPTTIAATGISLDKTTFTLTVGGTYTLTATVTPTTTTDKTVIWTSSDVTKATVSNGLVTAVGAGTVTITAQVGSQTATCVVTITARGVLSPGASVVINGVTWATHNVAAPGSFTTNPEVAGMFYQWNSKVGWSSTYPLTPSDGTSIWNGSWVGSSTPSSTDTWTAANNPCPIGYRVPTYTEIQTLLDAAKVTSTWTTQNSVYGRKFTDIATGNSIFLPAPGGRDYEVGTIYYDGSSGLYWSSTAAGGGAAYTLRFSSGSADWYDYNRANGFTLRPVAQ